MSDRSVLPTDSVLLARAEGAVVGVVRSCEELDVLVLRGMYVAQSLQRSGIGGALLAAASLAIGRRQCWCIPFSPPRNFYALAGFEEVSLAATPDFLAMRYADYEAQGASVIIMLRPQSSAP